MSDERSTLGEEKACKEVPDGVDEDGGGREEGSGKACTGGEPALNGGPSGRTFGILLAPSGTVGKYPPPEDIVLSADKGPNGDTSGTPALA